jgi:3-hydroxyacyl-[acyl-carrier-protein] dehydratase
VPEDFIIGGTKENDALVSDYKIPEPDLAFGIEEIQKCMLNKYPWQYLDRAISVEPGKFVHAIKNYSYNEWFFPPHFDGDPSVPGFIQIETCMQAFLLTFLSLDKYKRMETEDTLLDNIQLKRKIIPGDTLELKATLSSFKRGVGKGRVESFVNGELACSFDAVASIPAVLEPKPKEQQI